MSDPFIGQIECFSFNFVPEGWAKCDGQLLKRAAFPDLFDVIGTTYGGGGGENTFALPDLRGRVPLHCGEGPGLSSYAMAQAEGAESITLTIDNMPTHTHSVMVSSGTKLNSVPADNTFGGAAIYSNAPADSVMDPITIQPLGDNEPFTAMPPYLALNWCIAVAGTIPVPASI